MHQHFKITRTAFLMVAALSFNIMAEANQQLTPAQINHHLIGKELSGRVFAFNTTALYSPDGRLAVKTPVGIAKGTWTFSETGLCINITSGPRKGKTCMNVNYLGKGQFRTSEGNTFRIKN